MSYTEQPLAKNPQLDALSKRLATNVSDVERPISVVAGIGLIAFGIASRSRGSGLLALLGGAMIYRGVTGFCNFYRALGINSRGQNRESGVHGNKGRKAVETIMIRRPRAEIYRFWRQLDNLPRFMPHLQRVEQIDEFRSHWVVRTVAGATVEWHAEIINERENELLAWQSLPGADVQNAGSVWFTDAPEGGTKVKVDLDYYAPAGAIGDAVARIFGEAPGQQLQNDLRRLKELLESQPPAQSSASSSTLQSP
jgi:uncharacterized membrane protein